MRHTCAQCGDKQARYVVRPKAFNRKRVFSRCHSSHDLCKRCWVAVLNRSKASRL